MIRTFLTAFAMLAMIGLAGCAGIHSPLDDGYQFGDLTATVTDAQAKYCASADPYQRAVALALLHETGADIPARGACTDLLKLMPDAELEGVDVDAAREDQARYADQDPQ